MEIFAECLRASLISACPRIHRQAKKPCGIWPLNIYLKGKAGDYNQALMDLGATICLPKNPHCLICPLMELCEARLKGNQDQRPVLKLKKKAPHYVLAAAVIVKNGRVLLAKRPSKGLLGGMWEFPNGQGGWRSG